MASDPEYRPDLGTNPATVQMYDSYFAGKDGPLLKARIEDAARQVGVNPGLLAASLFAEFSPGYYARPNGQEVEGWLIGTDDYQERKADIEAKIPAAKALKPIRYEPHVNEAGRLIPGVPIFRAQQAVLASAVYLKHSELQVRSIMLSIGGSFDRLTVEHQFALTRYTMNAGAGAARKRVSELLGFSPGKKGLVHDKKPREFLAYTPWKLKDGVEQFSATHPQRAATAHAAQAIHLSQKIFAIYPAGGRDSLMFIR
jgi:hypothetical protein